MTQEFTFEIEPFEFAETLSGRFDETEWETGARFSFGGVPADVMALLRAGKWSEAVRRAIQQGDREEGHLSDLVFFQRHPERSGRYIQRGEPRYDQWSREWLQIRDTIVRPALRAGTGPSPLPPLNAAEQAELAKLGPVARTQFLTLRALIGSYQGVARTEADRGSRVLLRRGVFGAVNQLLPELMQLTGAKSLPPGWTLATARPLLVGNVLYNLAFPETINQGGTDRLGGRGDPTCFSASTQMLLAWRFPATYVRHARELATTRRIAFAGGAALGPLTFVSTSLYKSLDSVLLQTAFDTYFRTVAIVGGAYRPGDELKVHRQVFGSSRPPGRTTPSSSGNAVSAFRRAFVTSGGNTRRPEIVNLCTGNPAVNCGNHTVVLTRVASGRAYFYNPWANEEERTRMFGTATVTVSGNGERPAESSMTQANFEGQLTAVFHN